MKTIERQLAALPLGDELPYAIDDLVRLWRINKVGIEAMEPVLRYMEAHPFEDFGELESFRKFLEGFYKIGFEEALLKSLSRRPTIPTVSMLNGLINASAEPEKQQKYLASMHEAKRHNLPDNQVLEVIDGYLGRRRKGGE